VLRCGRRSRQQHRNLPRVPAYVAAQAGARCSLCAAGVIVVNAIAALSAAQRLGGSSGVRQQAIPARRSGPTRSPHSPTPLSRPAVSAPRDGSRFTIGHHAANHQALRTAQMLDLWLPAPLARSIHMTGPTAVNTGLERNS
jgi:hypothetical protein